MKIYHSIEEFPSSIKTIITIGTFDGVHKGHQVIIDRINDIARKERLQSLLLTFYPHPRHVLFEDNQDFRLINTIDEKIEFLSKTDLEHLVIHEFSKEFSRTKSVNFIRDVLVNKLNMKYMIIGHDHHFGKNREGTYDDLLALSELYGFQIERVEPQDVHDVVVSSTKIRNAIKEGDIKRVNSYLCCNFSASGKVVEGNKIGGSIGFPTANIQLNSKWKILPRDGVYAVKVFVKGEQYYGMLNIGNRPTVSDFKHVIEVYLLDFKSDIYNQEIKVEFIERIRDEKRFSDLERLRIQLKLDEINCKKIFNLRR